MEREELVAALRAADERLERLRAPIRTGAAAPLPEGEWRVRDALSHLAARGNPVPRVLQRLAEFERGEAAPTADIHAVNAEQVRARQARDVDALIDEIRAGHREALVALEGIDAVTLQRRLAVNFPPGELSAAEFILRAGSRHEGNHLDEIERALQPVR